MVNNEAFATRLKQVIQHYDLSAASFAERIGVQRSSISHLLSGRNKPSLDFVLKVLKEFPEVNLYWLMNGTGIFPDEVTTTPETQTSQQENITRNNPTSIVSQPKESMREKQEVAPIEIKNNDDSKEIERIVVFYKDGTFKNYTP